jgi:hypothetical protein
MKSPCFLCGCLFPTTNYLIQNCFSLSIYLSLYLSIYPSIYLSIYLCLYSPLLCLGRFSSFLMFDTVGRTPWTGDQPVARLLPAYRTAQAQNKRTLTYMPQAGFDPTIPVFERAKTVHDLDLTVTVISLQMHFFHILSDQNKSELDNSETKFPYCLPEALKLWDNFVFETRRLLRHLSVCNDVSLLMPYLQVSLGGHECSHPNTCHEFQTKSEKHKIEV